MDLKNTVQVFCSPGVGLSKSMISVDWSEAYNMKHHSALHQHIEETWAKKCQSPVLLFDASKFRLHKVETIDSDSSIKVKFFIGSTSYKEFIGTHYASCANQLVKDGIKLNSDSKSFLSNPIGVGAVIETEDHFLVFMRRSCKCAEMPGLLDRPGGHPEPSVVNFNLEQYKKSDKALEVCNELFDSVLKEIRDEINVPAELLSDPLLLGISYNPETFGRPSLEFYVRCNVTKEKIQELYLQQTHSEREESTGLLFIPMTEVLDVHKLKESKFYTELTHASQSALYLLQIFQSK